MAVGFKPIGDGWTSCYWHADVVIISYYLTWMISRWPDLSIIFTKVGRFFGKKGLVIEPESRIGKKELTYLGCNQKCFTMFIGVWQNGHCHGL